MEEASHARAKLDSPPQNITLNQLITEGTGAFLTPSLTCVSTLEAHTHTHLLIDAWVSLVFQPVSSLSVLPRRKAAPSRPSLLLLNQRGSSLQDSFQFGAVPPIPEQLPCPGHLHPSSHCMPPACHRASAIREKRSFVALNE